MILSDFVLEVVYWREAATAARALPSECHGPVVRLAVSVLALARHLPVFIYAVATFLSLYERTLFYCLLSEGLLANTAVIMVILALGQQTTAPTWLPPTADHWQYTCAQATLPLTQDRVASGRSFRPCEQTALVWFVLVYLLFYNYQRQCLSLPALHRRTGFTLSTTLAAVGTSSVFIVSGLFTSGEVVAGSVIGAVNGGVASHAFFRLARDLQEPALINGYHGWLYWLLNKLSLSTTHLRYGDHSSQRLDM